MYYIFRGSNVLSTVYFANLYSLITGVVVLRLVPPLTPAHSQAHGASRHQAACLQYNQASGCLPAV